MMLNARSPFMEQLLRYECLYNKLSKDYKKNKSEIIAGWQWARNQYYGGRSGEKVQVHSFKLREMAAKGKEGPVGFWKGYRAFCRRLVKLRMARTAH